MLIEAEVVEALACEAGESECEFRRSPQIKRRLYVERQRAKRNQKAQKS